ncbi:MAG: carbohydrate ABC transporter permease [Actinomycetes bacterium]
MASTTTDGPQPADTPTLGRSGDVARRRPGTPGRNTAAGIARRRQARAGWAYTGPAMLVIGLVTIFPILFSVVLSLNNVSVTGNGFALQQWTGHNYSLLIHASAWRNALVFTVAYTIITVAVEIILGTLAALVLERLTVGRGALMALLLIPWSMITVISAQLWSYIYNSTYGLATYLIHGVTGHSPVLLGTPTPAIVSMMVADIWKTTPFVTIIVLAGLVMLPQDVYEAAEMDGATGWTTFWRVTLPQLRPTVSIAVLFRILQAFGLFDLPFVLTGGGPGTSTQSLALLGWRVLFQDLNFGPGAAVATSTALLVLIGCLVFLQAFKSQVGREDVS